MTIYVNWDKRKIITAAEHEALIASETDRRLYDEDEFSYYLDSYFSSAEIFNFSDNERSCVEKGYAEFCRERAKSTVKSYWEAVTVAD